jgi:hypothetical protein
MKHAYVTRVCPFCYDAPKYVNTNVMQHARHISRTREKKDRPIVGVAFSLPSAS